MAMVHYCAGKVIHWELCNKLKFDHSTKWYKPESVLEKKTHKFLVMINKKNTKERKR